MDRFQILAAAKRIRHPLTGFPRIIQVKHRRDRIHPQTVDVIFIQPEERISDQEIAHFVAAQVENQRAPILVLALARIEVFIEIGPVEFRERMRVLRKMGRNPIDDHADAGLVKSIDEMPELIWRSKPAGRRIIIRDLISPRTFKRMLGNRHQFDVGVAHLDHVGQQRVRQFEVTERTIAFLELPPP